MENIVSTAPSMMDLARSTSQFIDGGFRAGEGETFTVLNPSTEEVVAEIAGASTAQVEEMIESARRAQPAWADLKPTERVEMLRGLVARLRVRTAEMREVLMAEAGCPGGSQPSAAGIMFFQVQVPIRQAEEVLDFYLTLPETTDNPIPIEERVSPFGKMAQSVQRYTPIGVVAGIAAYNYPLFTAIWKVMPALVTGNSVILRPSPLTPISALIFAQAAHECGLPAGILNVMIEGGVDGAQLLTTHKHVDMVAFTGSTAVGKMVMKQAADTMKRVQLELGGKSAQIFFPDSVDQAVGAAAGVCLSHAGQGCVLGTRIFVPDDAKAGVLASMKAMFEAVKIGPATGDDTVMGPVISAAQVQRCEHFVKLATDAGATVVTGGKRPASLNQGYYFEPTVLDTPDNSNPAAQEEIFGPVVSVIGYRDIDHAVEMANDSVYGLSGYVFGGDKAKALAVAKRLKTGAVNVNGGLSSTYASSGGHKQSGIGRERGLEGLRLYQNITCLTLTG
jgi:aldehyde dehydrogenase (NAD+)